MWYSVWYLTVTFWSQLMCHYMLVLIHVLRINIHAMPYMYIYSQLIESSVNTLRPRQNGRHFANDIFKCIFFNENVWIPIKISMKFVSKGPIKNIPASVQIMAWCRPGNKPLSEPMMVSLTTHICITQPQWVNVGAILWCIAPLTHDRMKQGPIGKDIVVIYLST